MNLKCVLTFHKWDGCKCTRCGKTRNKDHSWDGSKCSRCGKASPEEEARFLKAIVEGNYADIEIRLKASPGLFLCCDVHGNTPLHLAAEGGHESVVQLLLNHRANVNAKNQHGNTPLHVAAERDHEPVVQLLISHKASVGAKNQRGDTPLYVAARNDSESVGRLLVEATEAAILKEIETATEGRRFGLPANWHGDRSMLTALDVAKGSGSHKMAASLHRLKARLHRLKAELLTKRANMFAGMHNKTVAEYGSAGGMMQGFASEEARAAQREYSMAQEEDRAADREIALSVNANEKSKTNGGRIGEL
jgi:hypothetical protein